MTFNEYLKIANSIKTGAMTCSKKVNIAILGSYTMDYIKPILRAENYSLGIDTDIYIGQYNQYMQEILKEDSQLFEFKPDMVIFSIRLEELYPAVIEDFFNIKLQYNEIYSYIYNIFDNLIINLKNKLNSIILINNFISPLYNYSSLSDYQENGQTDFIRKLNLDLTKLIARYEGVYCVDAQNLAAKLGKENIYDYKMWYISKNPYKITFYIEMVKEYLKYEKVIMGLNKKCLVLDLDNTIWGGVVGEDGVEGIKLGDNYPGNVFKDVQKGILKLKNRGVILAINSKNNYEDAIEVFQKHSDMILKLEDFSCVKINWNDKASNIIEIARELNIGLDSIVFIDDNHIECELVKSRIPEVEIINLPTDIIKYYEIINSIDKFECINITLEDVKKTEMYRAQQQREKSKETFVDIVDFYRSLDMEIGIVEVNPVLVKRIAQLTQKTNQFNLTTKRYSEAQLLNMLEDKRYILYSISLKDRFGDYGIIGCCIIESLSQTEWYIDTFLLSCRVMNRTVENKFMNFLFNEAKLHGIHKLIGEYIPTKKNIPVKDFFSGIGYEKRDNKFILDVEKGTIPDLDYFRLIGISDKPMNNKN